MHLPHELSMLIQEFARPVTRGDWRRGSYMHRTCGYAALYWKTMTGFWYEFSHSNEEVRMSVYMYAWSTSRISGVSMLLGLAKYAPFPFTEKMFMRMSKQNLVSLVREAQYFDPDFVVSSSRFEIAREDLFRWLFL